MIKSNLVAFEAECTAFENNVCRAVVHFGTPVRLKEHRWECAFEIRGSFHAEKSVFAPDSLLAVRLGMHALRKIIESEAPEYRFCGGPIWLSLPFMPAPFANEYDDELARRIDALIREGMSRGLSRSAHTKTAIQRQPSHPFEELCACEFPEIKSSARIGIPRQSGDQWVAALEVTRLGQVEQYDCVGRDPFQSIVITVTEIRLRIKSDSEAKSQPDDPMSSYRLFAPCPPVEFGAELALEAEYHMMRMMAAAGREIERRHNEKSNA